MKLRPYEIVDMQDIRLKEFFTEDQIICINDEFKLLRDAYRREDEFKRFVDNFDHKTTFTEAWKSFVDRVPLLCQFAGGLASVFPGTSTVEADFSVIGWEKDEYRTALTDFSLEGILHSKQYEHLKRLSKLVEDHKAVP